jgi:hypothetical protein
MIASKRGEPSDQTSVAGCRSGEILKGDEDVRVGRTSILSAAAAALDAHECYRPAHLPVQVTDPVGQGAFSN